MSYYCPVVRGVRQGQTTVRIVGPGRLLVRVEIRSCQDNLLGILRYIPEQLFYTIIGIEIDILQRLSTATFIKTINVSL